MNKRELQLKTIANEFARWQVQLENLNSLNLYDANLEYANEGTSFKETLCGMIGRYNQEDASLTKFTNDVRKANKGGG